VNLETPLVALDFLPQVRARQLSRFGLPTVGDLLLHFPRRYEDRRQFDEFPTDTTEGAVCVCGIVARSQLRRIRGSQRMFDVILEDGRGTAIGGRLMLRWFNSPWVEKMFAHGQRVVVYGKPKRSGTNMVISHPDFEVVENDADESIHLKRIAPIHGATEGITPRLIRWIIWKVLERLTDADIPTLLPAKLDPTPRAWALRQMHFPESFEALEKARRHLVLEEFFRMQLAVASSRAEHQREPGAAHCGSGELMRRLHESLPFPLTGAQQRAIGEIRRDLASPHPMNRLLHGDVGAGKTLVAMSAMLLCVEAGFQAALMAPTQILAEQHYLNFKRLLDPLGIRVALRTGSRREGQEALDGSLFGPDDAPQILIGTHALLYEGAGFTKLGLAVIDEQHKFGVMQRALLRQGETDPHFLVMTATPIPRTVAMTQFGDLEVSLLRGSPPGRQPVHTYVAEDAQRARWWDFFRKKLREGQQGFVISHAVDREDEDDSPNAENLLENLSNGELADFRLDLLHGRMTSEQKIAAMQAFQEGKTQVLVSTSVVEVGVDVPNANLMTIEGGDRFGLSQLHQLRGRVGRGVFPGYVCVFSQAKSEEARQRLAAFAGTCDGFELAEVDFELRGPGELFGTRQHGLPPLMVADLRRDSDVLQRARADARSLMAAHPSLDDPAWSRLRRMVFARYGASLELVDVG